MNKCPFHTQKAVAAPADWWPDQLNFSALSKDPPGSKTVSKSYAEEIAILDIPGLKADLMTLMTTSQDWYTSYDQKLQFLASTDSNISERSRAALMPPIRL